MNVYGFNFAFRRADALAVGGFETDSGREGSVAELIAAGEAPPPSGRCEDGLTPTPRHGPVTDDW